MQFFYVSSKTESAGLPQLCAEKSVTSHTTPPPPVGAGGQWESPVCRMAEGGESLELFPPSKETKSVEWEFFG